MANRRIGRAETVRRQSILGRWRRSGESAAEFGGRLGIPARALYAWAEQAKSASHPGRRSQKRRSREVDAGASSDRQAFVPVQLLQDEHLHSSADGGFVEIRLRGGDVVRVVGEVSTARLGAVLTAVRQAC